MDLSPESFRNGYLALFDDRTQDAHLAALIDAHDNGGDGETIIVGQCQPAVKQWHDSLAVVVRDLRQRP